MEICSPSFLLIQSLNSMMYCTLCIITVLHSMGACLYLTSSPLSTYQVKRGSPQSSMYYHVIFSAWHGYCTQFVERRRERITKTAQYQYHFRLSCHVDGHEESRIFQEYIEYYQRLSCLFGLLGSVSLSNDDAAIKYQFSLVSSTPASTLSPFQNFSSFIV